MAAAPPRPTQEVPLHPRARRRPAVHGSPHSPRQVCSGTLAGAEGGPSGFSPQRPALGRPLLRAQQAPGRAGPELRGLPPEHHEASLPVLFAQVGGARLVMQYAFFGDDALGGCAVAGGWPQGLIQGVLPVHQPVEAHSDSGGLGGAADRAVRSGPGSSVAQPQERPLRKQGHGPSGAGDGTLPGG